MREKRPVGQLDIAEEEVNPVEKSSKALGIKAGGDVALGKAVSEAVICLPLGCHPPVCTENSEIAAV
jgi:hypothetical protein